MRIMRLLRGLNQRGTGVPERSVPMSNFCKTGIMSTCMEKDSGWVIQKACEFSDKASNADRCMYCVHNNTLCDNFKAQNAAKNGVDPTFDLDDVIDADFLDDDEELDEDLELEVEYTMDDMLKDIEESEKDSGPQITLPDPLGGYTLPSPNKGGA